MKSAKVRELREAAALSQMEVAKAIGMSRQEYALIDTGRLEASAETYKRIEAAILSLTRERLRSVREMAEAIPA